jgi:hypothetical protein
MLAQFIDRPCEDSLTAAVFSHLLHLPSELFWQIIWQACHSASLPRYAGEPRRDAEFWPRWKPDETRNSRFVEPDLFIRFPGFDLVIEAKRHDDCQQDQTQWKDEIIAYYNEYGPENTSVRLIAVGGIWDTNEQQVTCKGVTCPVHMCKWSNLLAECQRMERELQRLQYHSCQSLAHRRILLDLIELFSCHGYQTGVWFADLVSQPKRLTLASPAPRLSMRFCKLVSSRSTV